MPKIEFCIVCDYIPDTNIKIQDYDNNNFYKFKEPVLKDS